MLLLHDLAGLGGKDFSQVCLAGLLTYNYDVAADSKNRISLRGAQTKYFQVKALSNGCYVLESRVLVSPDEVPARTLKALKRNSEKLKNGKSAAAVVLPEGHVRQVKEPRNMIWRIVPRKIPLANSSAICNFVNMSATSTVSTRLDAADLSLIQSLAELEGCDRATLIKSLLRNGLKNLRRERAVEAFRREDVTLSRAAELAGLNSWDFLALMDSEKLEMHYGVAEFEEDLLALP